MGRRTEAKAVYREARLKSKRNLLDKATHTNFGTSILEQTVAHDTFEELAERILLFLNSKMSDAQPDFSISSKIEPTTYKANMPANNPTIAPNPGTGATKAMAALDDEVPEAVEVVDAVVLVELALVVLEVVAPVAVPAVVEVDTPADAEASAAAQMARPACSATMKIRQHRCADLSTLRRS